MCVYISKSKKFSNVMLVIFGMGQSGEIKDSQGRKTWELQKGEDICIPMADSC